MSDPAGRRLFAVRDGADQHDLSPEVMSRVARGDMTAYAAVYDALAPRVFGLIRQVLRDPSQSEEVTQEVMVEIWRSATRYDPARGSVTAWALTIAHRRAIDRVRAEQAATDRERVVARREGATAYDDVVDAVTTRLEAEQVRNCLGSLTELQRESITMAYYGGHSYREVAQLLDANLATVKARMRDGLIRLRDCLGAESR
jgi:RNA polymerase sigma-70 factor, ECF subfamily